MNGQERLLYESSSGDSWSLVRMGEDEVAVRHVPNRASGGRTGLFTLSEFLRDEAGRPEQRALLRLIADLVGKDEKADAATEAPPAAAPAAEI